MEKNGIGSIISVLREHRSLTQQTLADELGVTRSYVAMLESGAREPSLRILKKIARVFDVSAGAMLLLSERDVASIEPDPQRIVSALVKASLVEAEWLLTVEAPRA